MISSDKEDFWCLSIFKIVILYFLIKSCIKANNYQNSTNKNINNNSLQINSSNYSDIDLIINYNGGPLEQKWEWVTNISIVYTWVDGADIDYADIKSKYNGGNRLFNSRDRSANELCYSLRSLKKYLPWHKGTIFIVTDNQVPDWLNINNNSQIKIISHDDILPDHIKPTFDSSTLECFFDRIPNVSEVFIYLNDDFFFNNYIHPALFFNSMNFSPNFFRTHQYIFNINKIKRIIELNYIHDIYEGMIYYTNKIIKQYFDPNFIYYHIAHGAYLCYRDLFEYFRQFFKKELRVVFAHRFRSPYKPITLYLYQTLIYYTGKYYFSLYGKNSNYQSSYNRTISNYDSNIIPRNITDTFLKFSFVNDDSLSNYNRFNYFFNNKLILIYNINDKYLKKRALYEFTEFMIIRYPENCSFEKEEFVNLEKEYLYKLKYINKTLNFSHRYNNSKYYKKLFFNKKNRKYMKEYLEKRNGISLYQNQRNISKREIEEINFLFNYNGEELEPEWKWIENISIVYIIEEYKNIILDELKYSLRSIDKYLPWFKGTIFIIIEDKSFCSSLKQNNEHLVFIHPIDIISKKFRPSYNREIIELFLDKIPDITERFIYLNKYHYFERMTHPRLFFNNDFFPKYNLGTAFEEKPKKIKNSNSISFFETYELIQNIFGKNYVNNYRYLMEGPTPLYRDLFKPVRKLYLQDIISKKAASNGNFNILPIYLVMTYNIYGTDQIYYPEYVAGFGKIRNSPLPKLNKNRNITYYGFDITSKAILEKTNKNIIFKTNIYKTIKEIIENKTIFLSLKIKKRPNVFESKLLNYFFRNLYRKKSCYEI